MSPIVDLSGKRGLVIGIANENSIATGCAKSYVAAGAQIAVTYLNERAEPFVRPIAESLAASLILPCDVTRPGQLEQVFSAIETQWGQLDFVLHSIAFASSGALHVPLVDCSAEGFALAMDVSCHSFLRASKLALALMKDGGSLTTVSFYGAERAVAHYNVMGPVKAALESSVRYLAADLAEQRIHVHAISAGALKTRAASGIDDFDRLLDDVRARTPAHQLVSTDDVGRVAALLASDAGMALTGSTVYVDGGFHVVA
ncbi:enoyl-ACP reductase FabI [Burkholderia anthina]|uniref:enoyl-ACP reductase FabI n=1 Tax=Burkholderia anthina TaxID=179879 RepID=UPI00158BB6C1|nr:enoyl-ACP reductase FabI [Burkholderia anthina]MBY4868881.1 enoyl-ACP reductase FabI [Burkholderia anthina]